MDTYILVTGASSGLGRELAISLSKKRNIVINGRNMDRLALTKKECDNSHEVLIWQYDLEKTEELEDDFKGWISDEDITISGFVHCAGMSQMVPCKVLNIEILKRIYNINVFSAALILKMLTSKKINKSSLESVVFVSSNISNRGAKAFSVYGSSKAALDGLMRNLAIELAPKVRLNSVLPGGMITAMTEEIFEDEEMRKKFEHNSPLGMGTPQKVVPMIEFLLSEKSAWITGQQFTVDGGRTVNLSE